MKIRNIDIDDSENFSTYIGSATIKAENQKGKGRGKGKNKKTNGASKAPRWMRRANGIAFQRQKEEASS